MSLLSKKELQKYKDSYLYNTLHSYHDDSDNIRYVLTHYSPKNISNENAEEALEKLKGTQIQETPNDTATVPRLDTNTTKFITSKPAQPTQSTTMQTQEDWENNYWSPQKQKKRATNSNNPLSTKSHFEPIPTGSSTFTQKSKQSATPVQVSMPHTEIARQRPKASSVQQTKEQLIINEEQNNTRHGKNTKEREEEYLNLQSIFETAEWIAKANKLKVAIKTNIENIKNKKIKLTDLNDRSENYLDINKRSLNMINSIIIGKRLDIIIIFRDGTTLNIAPDTWLQNTNANVLIKGNYNYIYHDLDVEQLVKDLQPLCATEINQPQYMQLWLEFIPVIPVED